MFNRNFSPIIQNNKYINNNKLIFNHFYNYNNTPQYFHPHFHPNIPLGYISNLEIQCPVQIFVKQSKKMTIVKHKLVTYFPQKVQLEIRPCFIFQDYQNIQNIQMPSPRYQFQMFQMYSNQYNIQPHFQNTLYSNHYMNNSNNYNENINQRRVLRNKVKRKRPVFKIPACKKASVSQGQSLSFIFKYYDENFILEDEYEEEKANKEKIPESERKEKKENICKTESNYFSDNEGRRIKKRLEFSPEDDEKETHISHIKNDKKEKEKEKEFKNVIKLIKEIDINLNGSNKKNIEQNINEENVNTNNNKKNNNINDIKNINNNLNTKIDISNIENNQTEKDINKEINCNDKIKDNNTTENNLNNNISKNILNDISESDLNDYTIEYRKNKNDDLKNSKINTITSNKSPFTSNKTMSFNTENINKEEITTIPIYEEDKNKSLKYEKNDALLSLDDAKKRKNKKFEINERKENIIVLNIKKNKFHKIKFEKESLNNNEKKNNKIHRKNYSNSNNFKKNTIKTVKKRYNSINNLSKIYTTNKVEMKEKINNIDSSSKNLYKTVNNKKKEIKIINYDKNKNRFIQKSNSFLVNENNRIKNLSKKLIPKCIAPVTSLNTSYKKSIPKNKNKNKNSCNNIKVDHTNNYSNCNPYKTSDRPKSIIIKIDLTKI